MENKKLFFVKVCFYVGIIISFMSLWNTLIFLWIGGVVMVVSVFFMWLIEREEIQDDNR